MLIAIPVTAVMFNMGASRGYGFNHEPIWTFFFSILISLFCVERLVGENLPGS